MQMMEGVNKRIECKEGICHRKKTEEVKESSEEEHPCLSDLILYDFHSACVCPQCGCVKTSAVNPVGLS